SSKKNFTKGKVSRKTRAKDFSARSGTSPEASWAKVKKKAKRREKKKASSRARKKVRVKTRAKDFSAPLGILPAAFWVKVKKKVRTKDFSKARTRDFSKAKIFWKVKTRENSSLAKSGVFSSGSHRFSKKWPRLLRQLWARRLAVRLAGCSARLRVLG